MRSLYAASIGQLSSLRSILGKRYSHWKLGVSKPHWDETVALVESKCFKGWLDWEFIEVEYIRPMVSGDHNIYYLQHFFDQFLPNRPVTRALSLGCGGGNLERALITLGAAETIDAYDASRESIKLARQLAKQENLSKQINYEVADINALKLPSATYDFVVAKMSLHHFEALETVYEQVRQSLKPDGVFMFNEFIGPSRYQWTDLQLNLMNELLKLLPDHNRVSSFSGTRLERIDRPTVDEMIAMDPTEAVRSAEIVPLLGRYFEVAAFKPYGGTLLHILLTHTMHTFDLEDEDQVALLRSLFTFERTLIEHGVLSSDFAYAVARPRQ